MPGEHLLDISMSIGTGDDQFRFHVSNFPVTLVRPESADIRFVGYEVINMNSDGTVDLELTFEAWRVNDFPVRFLDIRALCVTQYECKGDISVRPGWEGENSTPHIIHLPISGWDPDTKNLKLTLSTDYSDRSHGTVNKEFGPFEVDVTAYAGGFIATDTLEAPEAEVTAYFIDEFHADGTIDATVHFLVHRFGAVPLNSFRIVAHCNDDPECGGSIDVYPGWLASDATPHVVHLPVRGLKASDQEVSFTISADYVTWFAGPYTREIGSIEINIPTAAEYTPVLEQGQAPILTIDSYEIGEYRLDGTIDVKTVFQVNRANDIPVRDFTVQVQCVSQPACNAATKDPRGWRDDNTETLFIGVLIENLTSGTHTLDAAISANYVVPNGVEVTQSIEPFIIDIPMVPEPIVEAVGHEIISYNQDGTANIELGFRYYHSDALPVASIDTAVECRHTSDDITCLSETSIKPDFQTATPGFDYKVAINSIKPGPVLISAMINLNDDDLESPPRNIPVDDQTIIVPEQPPVDIRWNVEAIDIDGYFMDGSARADITLAAAQIGYEKVVQVPVSAVCIVGEADESVDCVDSNQILSIENGYRSASIKINDFALPLGRQTIRIDADSASGRAEIESPLRIVGIERDIWECFNETEVEHGETCSGFNDPIVYKWNLDRVNVYREGADEYIAAFDESLKVIETVTGIEYVIVDTRDDARIEAYLGHEGNDRVRTLFGDECSFVVPGCAYYLSDDKPYVIDRGYIAVAKRQPEWRDHAISLEDEIRYTTMHELLHVTIPVGHDSRFFNPVVAPPPTYMRQEDIQMYRMIYFPLVKPEMPFADIAQFIVFADETIDYEPSPPNPYEVLQQARNTLIDFDSIRMTLTGGDMRGSVYYQGPEIEVHYASYRENISTKVRFVSQSWNSIIFGIDQETWSSAGGRWTQSSGHQGRGRRYRDYLQFDFILADPLRVLSRALYGNTDITLREKSNGNFTIAATDIGDGYPRTDIDLVINRETYQIIEYSIEWQLGPDRYKELPYRVEAEIIDYGAEFDVPEEVQEKSQYLSSP